ncbi:hypothetical protein FCE95_08985 [Luteimonas gilva]|uniref:Uncharacterized protein n=1 Tax=Luteimonas gilva TaxID=2572684 RepID=A0A4U5JL21_9GAMM|nr:hypothetical protein FCE95_08985 [Luteimonas gilva]
MANPIALLFSEPNASLPTPTAVLLSPITPLSKPSATLSLPTTWLLTPQAKELMPAALLLLAYSLFGSPTATSQTSPAWTGRQARAVNNASVNNAGLWNEFNWVFMGLSRE